ncbi:YegS/Rv2252/BmrU family lipid kinase [Ornithinibacillus sp. L9]|uniref:YegS/Rv2252/BmrU family lipid kinase n=1 Tax=Ornithinibacillus caprae TaxID=2678566 RepID=A0A6N8FHX8_9BACI|nr:diacylglycerol kinase family protein [Ornithinibacillus caprae]MUK86918.1 YegS/Rv2252/BmrU family lipid kinase [Ornithinibacillus caprae]
MYYFIVNKYSGSGRALKIWRRVAKLLQEKHIDYDVSITEHPHHASELVKDIMKKNNVKAIIAVGGDGTVHEIINGLIGSKIPLGIIPAGSGNDFCRGMRIPLKYDQALERILKGDKKTIDVGHINNKFFATIVGIGFDGQVAQKTNQSQNKKILNLAGMGSLSYIINVLKVLFYYKPTNVDLHIDQEPIKHQNVWLIAIANSPFYAGGMMICPNAKNDDQLFDVCIVKEISRWQLLRIFPSVFKGKHVNHSAVTIFKAKELEILSKRPMTAHGDGEIIGETPLKIMISPSTLSVL